MHPFQIRPSHGLLAAAIAVAVLAGCTRHDASAYIASANSYLAKSDYKAAIIEVKNALQQSPENGQARLLLAKALFATGDLQGAEAETRKAIDQHVADDDTYPLLARTLLAQGKFGEVLKYAGTRQLGTPEARADLAVSVAGAYSAQGDTSKAKAALEVALAETPGNAQALLLAAQLASRAGDPAAARNYVALALARAPDNTEALVARAEIEFASGETDSAQKTLERAIEGHPELLVPRFILASVALRSGKVEIAKAQVAKMKQLSPADVRTVYSDALLAFVEKDNTRARDEVQKVLGIYPDHLPSLMLSGLVNLRLGSLGVAEDALRRVAARAPGDPSVARMLAELYIRTGRASQAVQSLDAELRRTPDDPSLLRAAAEAYLAAGSVAQATHSYERANALDKGNISSQVRLAQVRLAAGDTARALNDLESLAASDSSKLQADLALFNAHLRRREYDKALAAVDAMEKKKPNTALPSFLRGNVYLARRDLKKARASFDAALKQEPDFHPAGYNLAVIDIQEGHPQLARERYERMLTKSPQNERLLLASAESIAITGGSVAEIRGAYDRAIAANPMSPPARLALIKYLSSQQETKAAVDAALAAVKAIPNDPQLLDALGMAQLATDPKEALETFKRGVDMQPQNAMGYVRLAEVQTMLKNYESALVSERKALSLKPDLPQAYVALVKTYVASGQHDQAIAEARKLQKEYPGKALGYALEAEILAAEKKWPQAAEVFKKALSIQPLPLLATRTYAAWEAAGKPSEAAAFAKKWMSEHPKDTTMPLLFAQRDLQRKDVKAARIGYERVLQIDPDNAVALNNLAWILTDAGNPKGLEYAEQAHRLAPFSPNVLDTLGWALVRDGKAERGVPILRMASTLAPRNGEIRLHFAKALRESGDKAGAREELTTLTKLDKESPIRIEAEKLLASP